MHLEALVDDGLANAHRRSKRPHLVRVRAETEEILLAHLARDLDVGAVPGAHDESAVHDEFHVSSAAASIPAVLMCCEMSDAG